MKQLIYSSISIVALSGCASTDYQVVASADQRQTHKNSISAVVSEKHNIVSVKVDRFIDGKFDYPAVMIGIKNNDSQPFELALEDITVFAGGQQIDLVDPTTELPERLHRLTLLNRNHTQRANRSVRVGKNGDRSANATHHAGRKASSFITGSYEAFIHNQVANTVIDPEEFYGGYISLDIARQNLPEQITLVMNIEGERHQFSVNRKDG